MSNNISNRIMPVLCEEKQFDDFKFEDGNCILLIEGSQEERTFKMYDNLIQCIDAIVKYYDGYLESESRDNKNYVIGDLMLWIDGFRRMELFVFNKTISRYKRLPRSELKDLFIQVLQKLADSEPNEEAKTNGKKLGSIGDDDDEEEDDDDDSDENWD